MREHVDQYRVLVRLAWMHRNATRYEAHVAAYYENKKDFHVACFTTLANFGEHNH